MMRTRKPKSEHAPEVAPRDDKKIVRQTRRYRLITPLFGGGAETQKPDAVTVVRGSEIRGQLRFWWRATRGGQFADLAALRRAEEAIWGSAAAKGKPGPSPISVVVDSAVEGTERKSVKVRKWNRRNRRNELVDVHIADPSSPYSYVAFPLREERDRGKVKKAAGSVWEGVEFRLTIIWDLSKDIEIDGQPLDLIQEINAALWAWETFGGIGARTRRGFGALQLLDIDGSPMPAPHRNDIESLIEKGLREHVIDPSNSSLIPHVSSTVLPVVTDAFRNADEAWMYLFQKLRDFRQDRYKSQRYNNRPGRSKWPEPDAIRRLTDTHHPDHEPFHPVKDKFPRGQFGLPINFQFVRDDVKGGDPLPAALQSETSERFASRLILRPLACEKGAVGLAYVLAGPEEPPGGFVLKTNRGDFKVKIKPEQNDADLIEPLNGETDVLKAFLKTL